MNPHFNWWCPYRPDMFCQEAAGCSECAIFKRDRPQDEQGPKCKSAYWNKVRRR